jgi:MFS superfamily sulfate permease-like transporter
MVNSLKGRKSHHFTKEELIKLDEQAHTLVYTIKGQLAYINAQAHISRFETRLNGSLNIVLRMRELYFIDLDGVEAIDEILEICDRQHREVYITGVNPFIAEMLRHSNDFRRLEMEGRVVQKSSDALQKLGIKLEKQTSP